MDITFRTEEGTFNHRAAAVIMNKGRLLVMRDDGIGHYYLPGGRVRLHETGEQAILRELREELELEAEIIRPLWIVQSYFSLDTTGERFHEIAFYYLVDICSAADNRLAEGIDTDMTEGNKLHEFRWIEPEGLKEMYFYPLFLKEQINNIPEHPVFIIETQ